MPHVSPRSRLARRALILSGSVAGAGLLAWGVYALAKLGPKDAVEPTGTEVRSGLSAVQRELAAEVAAIERALREAAGNQTETVRLAKIGRAIALQEQVVQLSRSPIREEIERLERLEAARDTWATEGKLARIAELEQAIAVAQRAGRDEAANAALREAVQLQQEINRSRAAARAKDFVRETRLTLQLEEAEAAPLRQRTDEAVARGEAAAQRSDWAEALAAKQAAHATLAELNQRFPQSRLADLRLQDALAKEVIALEAAGTAAEVDAQEIGGDAAAAAGRATMAAEFYQAAWLAQAEVNRRFAGSRFASTRRVEALDVKRQTVLADEAWQQVVALDAAAAELLRKRQVANALAKVAEAAALLAKIETAWPKRRGGDGAMKLKLAFIERHRADLRALQDEIYGQLLPVPQVPNRLMLRTEVTQELYAQIMNTNPSRNAGRKRPVDSVDWGGAREFCARVSWLLGAVVRLSTSNEFRHALGRGASPAWTKENSDGQSQAVGGQPANENGFCDLTGNLAEWLDDDSVGANALVAGGSYLDAAPMTGAEAANGVAVAKSTQARHVGFRVVVEFPLE